MKIFINAVSIKEGGSRVVLTKLLSYMRSERPDVLWLVAADPEIAVDISDEPSVTCLDLSRIGSNPVQVLYWYEYGLPKAIKKLHPDVLFSLTNYIPSGKIPCPTLLLEQHAGHFSVEFDRLRDIADPSTFNGIAWRLKRYWVRRSIRRTHRLTVQTNALADAIAATGSRARSDIHVIPHGSGQVNRRISVAGRPSPDIYRIGYLTKWGVQKNFHTLFEAVQLLQQQGLPLKIVLTLDEDSGCGRDLLHDAKNMGLASVIENHGDVSGDEIVALYDSLDMFVFCSVCESFGFPMVEAMARALPVVAAATPVNYEITGSAGMMFPAYDADQLADCLKSLMTDSVKRQMYASLSLERSRAFSWQNTAAQTLKLLEEVASIGR